MLNQAIPINALWTTEAPAGPTVTHEAYIHAVADLAKARLDGEARARLAGTKIVFGTGSPGVRGTCYYNGWSNGLAADLIEVCAFGRESDTQLAGTTLHELAHVLTGHGAGHDKSWKAACSLLGLTTALAEGQAYAPDHFAADLWPAIEALPKPTDGVPNPTRAGALGTMLGLLGFRGGKGGTCRAGQGTKGGRSTGPGSGRLRLWECKCSPPVKVRVASDTFKAQCLVCNNPFERGAVAGALPLAQPPATVEPPTGGGTTPAEQGGGPAGKGADPC